MKTLLAFLALSSIATSAFAATIAIDSTNFSRIGGGTVSNTNVGLNHSVLQYTPGTNYLGSDQRFTLTFNYSSLGARPGGGVGLWFGTSIEANWVFVNEEFAPGSADQLRNFSARNLSNNSNASGNVTTTASIPDANLISGVSYTLTVERTLIAGNFFLDIKVHNASTNALIASMSDINVGTDANWGITLYATPDNGTSTSLTTTTITNLSVTAIPEPTTIAALFSGVGALMLFRRRNSRLP